MPKFRVSKIVKNHKDYEAKNIDDALQCARNDPDFELQHNEGVKTQEGWKVEQIETNKKGCT